MVLNFNLPASVLEMAIEFIPHFFFSLSVGCVGWTVEWGLFTTVWIPLITTETIRRFIFIVVTRRCFHSLSADAALVTFQIYVAGVFDCRLLSLLKQNHVLTIRVEVWEVQRIVHLVFNLNRLSEAEVVMPFFKCVEVNVFVVLDEWGTRPISISILNYLCGRPSAFELPVVTRLSV